MELWQALILGLVEGLTEYLPVSSTGHLLVTQRLLGIESSEAANAYAIVIQAGAIAAVLGLYRRRVAQMALGLMGRDVTGLAIVRAVVLGFLPAAVAGLTLDARIERYLFGAWPVVAAWAAGGIFILVFAERIRRQGGAPLHSITGRMALLIGLCQCAALWPGVSRSLATIVGGVVSGLALGAAVEFSFLLGVLTLGAATTYKALGSGRAMLEAYGLTELALGFVVAWLAAIVSVKWMIRWLNERGLALFGWWRLSVATVVAALLLLGIL
jgi:undecaprenyl-diphosphatase